MKTALALVAVLAVVGLALGSIPEKEDELFDLLMSDMPLKVRDEVSRPLEGEHQANDMGQVLILLVPYCEGTAI